MRDDGVHVQAKARVAGVSQFFKHHALMGKRSTRSAVFVGDIGQQNTEFASLVPDCAIDVLLLFPGLLMRGDFGGDEAPHGIAETL